MVNELYSKRDYLTFKGSTTLPVVVVEESNCPYGPLVTSITRELALTGSCRLVVTNSHVDNIPANSTWEKDMMISEQEVRNLVERALQ